jgi:hypothetical protein
VIAERGCGYIGFGDVYVLINLGGPIGRQPRLVTSLPKRRKSGEVVCRRQTGASRANQMGWAEFEPVSQGAEGAENLMPPLQNCLFRISRSCLGSAFGSFPRNGILGPRMYKLCLLSEGQSLVRNAGACGDRQHAIFGHPRANREGQNRCFKYMPRAVRPQGRRRINRPIHGRFAADIFVLSIDKA